MLGELEQAAANVCPLSADIAGRPWKETTNAAKILERIFNQLSETRVAFERTEHAVRLAEWIATNAPEELYGALRPNR